MNKITPCLWFDKEAGEAAKFYVSVFKDAKIVRSTVLHDTPSGDTKIVVIELFGQRMTLMSAGPTFKITEAISFEVRCDNQEEIDYYWEKLSAVSESEQCGWLKDKFGVSWQIVPKAMDTMMQDSDPERLARVTQSLLKMKKLDIAELEQVYEGK